MQTPRCIAPVGFALLFLLGCLLLSADNAVAGTLSAPAVDRYNVRVGTETFSGQYHFTTNTLLNETAQAMYDMGSDIMKMEIAPGFADKYNISLGSKITNLVTLVRDEPSCRHVFDMGFRHYVLWTYPFSYWWPFDGYSSSERSSEYTEFYNLTRYLLTNYNNSGKTFYLGHWEGDGYLTGSNFSTNPTPTMIQGFIDCLNNRQKAIDDAKAATGFSNVNVYCYAEANRVRDAINNNPNTNLRMINTVIPYVTNLDYVSYSSYDMQRLTASPMTSTLDYMEAHLPTNKAAVIPGERIWIGEYGFANAGDTPAAQEPETRAYIQRLLDYGVRGIPFILFWEIYDNETNSDGSFKYFYLIDQNNAKAPCYYLHQRFINNARLLTAQFQETNGHLPNDAEFVSLVSPMLNQPLAAPIPLNVSNGPASVSTNLSASVSGTLAQGIYGDDEATVWAFCGRQDGGTNPNAWEFSSRIGVNTNFNPQTFTALFTNLVGGTNYWYRFYASNATGQAWAPASSQFSTTLLSPDSFGSRLKITFSGYNRGEVLQNFPALVLLNTSLPGFSYLQFASPTGGDLRFTAADGLTPLLYEIDEWNTNGTSSVWVRVPELTGVNDYIWAYWGNPAATNPPASSTDGTAWSSDHLLVWHLKENTLPFQDSARLHPASSGVAPTSTTGQIGKGVFFNGSSQYLNGGPVDLGSAFTLSAWVKLDNTETNIQTIWANKPGGWNSDGFALFVNSFQTADQKVILETGNGTTGTTASTAAGALGPGQWHRVTAVVDRVDGNARLYIDGTDATQTTAVQTDMEYQTAVNLGRFTNGTSFLKGILDEVRIESGTRSSNWVWASAMTVSSNSSLVSYAPVTRPPPLLSVAAAGAGLSLSWPSRGVGYSLYTATNLTPPISWSLATNRPAFTGSNWQLNLSNASGVAAFYRLQSQ